MIVEMINYHFTVRSTFSIVILVKLVANNDVKNETQIPADVTKRGKKALS
jgi:hypothetical protein